MVLIAQDDFIEYKARKRGKQLIIVFMFEKKDKFSLVLR